MTRDEAIQAAIRVFQSPEFLPSQLLACMALVAGSIPIFCEFRAFNVKASDRNGFYCFVLTRKAVWWYPGNECPDPDTVEVVWPEEK